MATSLLTQRGFRARVRRLQELDPGPVRQVGPALLEHARAHLREDPVEAMQAARLARRASERVADDEGGREALCVLGEAAQVQGRFRVALRSLDRAQAMATADAEAVARIDLIRLHSLIHLERHDEAQATGERLCRGFADAGDANGEIRAHMSLADVALRRDEPKEALRQYAAVDRLLGRRRPPRFCGALAANRAYALECCNRFRAAERHFGIARELFAQRSCEHTLAQVNYNASYTELLRGRFGAALSGYAQSEEAFERLGDDRHLALIDLERAEIHLQLHLPQEARRLARAARERFERLGMLKELAQSVQLAGQAAGLCGETGQAEDELSEACLRFERLGLKEKAVVCFVQRADLALRAECHEEARIRVDEAERRLDGCESPLVTASVQLARARLELAVGEPTLALQLADGVRDLFRHVHAPRLLIEAHRLMGAAYRERAQVEEAILAYKHAIDALEHYRGGVPPDEYMTSFLSGWADLYAEIVVLLVRAGHHELAYEFAERGKSRALVDLLRDRRDARTPAVRGTLTAARVETLRQRLGAIYRRLLRSESGIEKRSSRFEAAARRQVARIEDEMARLLRESRLQDREQASLAATDAPTLEEIQADLEPGTTLLEYFVARDETIAFVVTREELHVVRREVPSGELRRLLDRFRFHLARLERETGEVPDFVLRATAANLAEIGRHLIEPVAGQLHASRLVIVPHGVLYALPFHALPWGGDGEYLVDRFEVVYAPSAAVRTFCGTRGEAAKGPACVFGLPDAIAPEVEREVHAVAATLEGSHLYLNDAATLDRIRTEAREARIVHIATHGMFRREQPMLSALRLADAWLNLYDIYDLELNAELVVLSACESGTADVTEGDEILGLTRGFLYAGARALLASQWRVHDESAARYMESFYRRLETGADAADASRHAMAEVRTFRPHPYYWAPFFLTGRPPVKKERSEQGEAGAKAATARSEGGAIRSMH